MLKINNFMEVFLRQGPKTLRFRMIPWLRVVVPSLLSLLRMLKVKNIMKVFLQQGPQTLRVRMIPCLIDVVPSSCQFNSKGKCSQMQHSVQLARE